MTLVLELPPEVEKAARELAAERGQTLERWALQALRQAARDPLDELLANAPEDDEPLTEEDLAAIERTRAAIARGELVPHEEVVRRSRERAMAA